MSIMMHLELHNFDMLIIGIKQRFKVEPHVSTILGSYVYLELKKILQQFLEEEKKVRDHLQVKMESYSEA